MNDGERQLAERIAKLDDLALLRALNAHDSDLNDVERGIVKDILGYAQGGPRLTLKQRRWAETLARRVMPIDSRDVPTGRHVETPAVLRNLPKAPPGRFHRAGEVGFAGMVTFNCPKHGDVIMCACPKKDGAK